MIRNKAKFLKYLFFFSGFAIAYPPCLFAQNTDSTTVNNYQALFWSSYGLGYSSGMFFLYQTWYKDYKHSSFHWFDDSREWRQMDKAGHAFSSFYLAKAAYRGLKWAGYSDKKASMWAGINSFFTVSSIELFDAYSVKWGASYSDLIANSAGSLLFYFKNISQRSYFDLKFSFHTSPYATMRPDALGKNWFEQIIKDYNGQTYWFSLNAHECGIEKSPPWLNIAWGYSAENMLSGTSNDSYRQYFLSLDINARALKTKNKWLKAMLNTLNIIKLPFPAIEFSQHKFKINPLYF